MTVNGKIQGHFKAFECFSSTFQGKFNFQVLFKTVLFIQVLFKSVRTLQLNWQEKWIEYDNEKRNQQDETISSEDGITENCLHNSYNKDT